MSSFLGARRQLNESATEVASLGPDAIQHEQDEEAESLMTSIFFDDLERHAAEVNQMDDNAMDEPLRHSDTNSSKKRKLKEGVVQKASEAALEMSTRQEYARYWQQFVEFLQKADMVDEGGVDKIIHNLPKDFPEWICAWIMSRADTIDIWTGEESHPKTARVSYGHAQKMRASITHKFGRDYGFGPAPWQEKLMDPGHYTGNPSISSTVSQYMISLRRRKVKSGEVVTSARAMNEDIMKRLYEFNQSVPKKPSTESKTKKRKAEDESEWAGYHARVMLHCIYTISMLCLLRYDEALEIRWEDITVGVTVSGIPFLCLRLPFRKTHQYGDIIPFYLYFDPDKPHMCAVTALAEWWALAGELKIQRFGYVFRRRRGHNQIHHSANEKMSSEAFLTCLRNNLCDIRVNPRMYGTHSFRRGGCQYLHTVLRWPIREICTWGGWAEGFDSPGTIFKYLLSWVDTPLIERHDYFNPDRKGTNPCTRCNRTCNCA